MQKSASDISRAAHTAHIGFSFSKSDIIKPYLFEKLGFYHTKNILTLALHAIIKVSKLLIYNNNGNKRPPLRGRFFGFAQSFQHVQKHVQMWITALLAAFCLSRHLSDVEVAPMVYNPQYGQKERRPGTAQCGRHRLQSYQ